MPIVPFPITAEDFDGFKAQMLELIRVLYEENWGGVALPKSTPTSEIESGGSDAGVVGGGHIVIFPWHYHQVLQGSWQLYGGTTYDLYLYNYVFYCTTNNAELQYKVYLAQGTYTARLAFERGGQHGIVKIYIDGIEKGTFDTYGSLSPIYFLTIENIIINTNGLKNLNLAIRDKNVSSGGCGVYLQSLCLFRTA